MKRLCLNLSCAMQSDLSDCQNKRLPYLKEIESCFAISLNYWIQVREMLCFYKFERKEAEIYFFKELKPKFTSEMEYYNLLYHSELFRPSEDTCQFWKREDARLEDFIKNNKEFYSYYKNGCTLHDEKYFIRTFDQQQVDLKFCDLDSRAATSHDHLVCTLIALERYKIYTAQKLTSCSELV